MLSKIIDFYNQILQDKEGHRYRSWEHCFIAFGNSSLSIDTLNLHLAFYLASWGMYRGSSGLLWKDYTIHSNAVGIIQKYSGLRITPKNLYPKVSLIFDCITDLKNYYSGVSYFNNKSLQKITATDTLLTKIMLGVFGVIPAFDRYFLSGANAILGFSSFNQQNLSLLYGFAKEHEKEIKSCQEYILVNSNFWYPPMKILDMYFWQVGFKLQ